jgi:hypothetical protein
MLLNLNELLQITAILLHYVQALGCAKASFSSNDAYYYKIWYNDRDLLKSPSWTIGDINEDIKSIWNIIQEPYTAMHYDMERIGTVLTLMGAVLNHNKQNIEEQSNKSSSKVLSIDELLQAAKITMQTVGDSNSFSKNDLYYQKVNYQNRDFGVDNPKITLGYIDEDMQRLEKVLMGSASPEYYDLERLGAVYIAVGAIAAK